MNIGQNIRTIRELKNLTQVYVARRMGISANAYSKIERGQTNISTERLQQVATALGTTAALILNFNGEELLAAHTGMQTLLSEIRLLREELRAKR